VLLILPADFFDKGESLCLSVILLDTECPACGMSRAVQHLLHFDFETAAQFNKLSFIVLPILMVVWVIEVRKSYLSLKDKKNQKSA
jgi:hypothetical protein